jgi:hypothetical protein
MNMGGEKAKQNLQFGVNILNIPIPGSVSIITFFFTACPIVGSEQEIKRSGRERERERESRRRHLLELRRINSSVNGLFVALFHVK